MNNAFEFWFSLIVALSCFVSIYLRHSKNTIRIANWYHKLSINPSILSQVSAYLLSGRFFSPVSFEAELRRKEKAKFVSIMIGILGCVFLFMGAGYLFT